MTNPAVDLAALGWWKTLKKSLLTGVIATTLSAAGANTSLPKLGDPSERTLSPAKSRAIGQGFFRQVRQQPNYIADPVVNHYINALGDHMVDSNDLGNQSFTFFVLDNPTINAFAVPGGYIGFYRGLIQLTQNESQLVSVMAHEIAHVTQRHLARIYAKQEDVSVATFAAVLAGILASAQGNSQVGSAAIYAGIAGSAQSQITFTREHELEADRIGIQLMARSRYNVQGVSEMFSLMQRATVQREDEQLEFLRTHPLSSRRVAEAQNFARTQDNSSAVTDSLNYQLVKARLKVLGSANPAQLLRSTEQDIVTREPTDTELYVMAFSHQRLEQHSEASQLAAQLLQRHPDSVYAQLLKVSSEISLGEHENAHATMRELHANFPDHYPVLVLQDELLQQTKQHQQAIEIWQDYLFNHPKPDTDAYRLLAAQQKASGETAASRTSLSSYFLALGDRSAAHHQLTLALKDPNISESQKQQVQARIDELTRERDSESE
ncbi:MAG: M48 family metalloprotease [Pseudomonadota bacterium]